VCTTCVKERVEGGGGFALLQLSFRIPGKQTPPHSYCGLCGERCPALEPSSTRRSPVNKPPSRLPSRALMERDTHPLSPLPHILPDFQ